MSKMLFSLTFTTQNKTEKSRNKYKQHYHHQNDNQLPATNISNKKR